MSDYNPERERLERLTNLDTTKASNRGRPPRPEGASASPEETPASGTKPGPRSARASNVDTPAERPSATSNVDTPATPLPARQSNVDTPAGNAAASNVDTLASKLNAAATGSSPAEPSPSFRIDAPPTPGKHQWTPFRPKPLVVEPVGSLDEMRKQSEERLRAKAAPQESAILGSSTESTRTEETRAQYAQRGRQLVKRFHREMSIPFGTDLAPVPFATWFLSLRTQLSASAWRYYKQAALFQLSQIQSTDAQDAASLIERETSWDSEMDMRGNRAVPIKKTKSKGKVVVSATKAKYFDLEDLARLDAYLIMRTWGEHAPTLRNWLRAGIATGLRPDEWRSTELLRFRDRVFLTVLNAKNTNNRANGHMRTIEITNFTDETMQAVEQMSADGAKWNTEEKYDSIQSAVSQTLYRADNFLWPKRSHTYALYSCRHQFILNQRALNTPEAELSALLGHQVTETQLTHYGKRSKGWSVDKILDRAQAYHSEVDTVKKTLDHVQRREKLEALIARKPGRTAPAPVSDEMDFDQTFGESSYDYTPDQDV